MRAMSYVQRGMLKPGLSWPAYLQNRLIYFHMDHNKRLYECVSWRILSFRWDLDLRQNL